VINIISPPLYRWVYRLQYWVGPRAAVNFIEKRKIFIFYRELKPDSSAAQPVK
jgi:hypothetical protein